MDRLKAFAKAKAKVHEALSRKDLSVIQAVRAIDDIDKAKSLLYERLTEWYKLNFPELSLQNEETYCKFIIAFGSKDEIEYTELEKIVGEDRAPKVLEQAQKSFGANFSNDDKKAIVAMARQVLGLFVARTELEEYVKSACEKEMRNISYLAEPLLAARLLQTAGSLERLAKMPASTIQVIGAEKALFKHLQRGSNPPKHGLIFQFAAIRSAPLKQRGRIARDLAGKLAIAAKADFYTQRFIGVELKAKFDKRLKEIKAT